MNSMNEEYLYLSYHVPLHLLILIKATSKEPSQPFFFNLSHQIHFSISIKFLEFIDPAYRHSF